MAKTKDLTKEQLLESFDSLTLTDQVEIFKSLEAKLEKRKINASDELKLIESLKGGGK